MTLIGFVAGQATFYLAILSWDALKEYRWKRKQRKYNERDFR